MAKRSTVLGAGALVGAGVLLLARASIEAVVGEFATKLLNPALFKEGGMLTFSFSDILILSLLMAGLVGIFWPWISKKLQTELDRKTVRLELSERKVVCGYHFTDAAEIERVADKRRSVFIECHFTPPTLFLPDWSLDDGWFMEYEKIVEVTAEYVDEARKLVPTINSGKFLGCRFDPGVLLTTSEGVAFLDRNGGVKNKTSYEDWKATL